MHCADLILVEISHKLLIETQKRFYLLLKRVSPLLALFADRFIRPPGGGSLSMLSSGNFDHVFDFPFPIDICPTCTHVYLNLV